jgi:hypothetical protein
MIPSQSPEIVVSEGVKTKQQKNNNLKKESKPT